MNWFDPARHPTRVVLTLLFCASLLAAGKARGAEASYTVRMQPVPGANGAAVLMDYIAFDPATHLVWVPAGNTGGVAVIDPSGGAARRIDGFVTAEMGTGERRRKVGPAVDLGQRSGQLVDCRGLAGRHVVHLLGRRLVLHREEVGQDVVKSVDEVAGLPTILVRGGRQAMDDLGREDGHDPGVWVVQRLPRSIG